MDAKTKSRINNLKTNLFENIKKTKYINPPIKNIKGGFCYEKNIIYTIAYNKI